MKKPLFQHVLACFAAAVFISTLTACGGGTEPVPKTKISTASKTETTSNKNSTDTNIHVTDESTTRIPTYTVGGYITGLLTNHSIKLLNNGTEPLLLTQDGSFAFPTALAQNASYNVTIDSQPPWRKCNIKNGQGIVAAHINNIDISCDDAQGEVKTVFSNLEINDSVAINSSDEIFMRQGFSFNKYSEAQSLKFSFYGFLRPIGDHSPVAVDKTGNIFAGNIDFSSITKLTPNSNSANGYDMKHMWAGNPNGYYGDPNAFIRYPKAMASDSSGNIYLVNGTSPGPNPSATAYRVVKIPASGAANRSQVEDYDNPAFGTISAIAVDKKDNLYLADTTNQKIWKIPVGTKTPQAFYAAGFTLGNQPVGMVFDQADNMFIAHGTRIYMMKADGPLGALRAAVVAGDGTAGNTDGIGNAAKFMAATAIAIDSAGNLFVTDKASNPTNVAFDYTLRKVTLKK